ncbi:MAG: segregation/condensation protein A [bacterium]|nr:segregation/condensation protein A [bacterium]
MAFAVDTAVYKGPIEKLLELVQEKKFEITELSLAEVTGDFLRYFESLRQAQGIKEEEQDLKALIADFLVVASRLLLIKSRVLLPQLELDEEEEEDIRDLELRLKLYQELKGTKGYVRDIWRDTPYMVGREFLMAKEPMFLPPKGLQPSHLEEAVRQMVEELQRFLMPEEKMKRVIVRLQDKIQEILERLTEKPMDLGHLDGKKKREEIVMLFLAVLHLVRDHFIHVEQSEEFGRIYIRK